MYNRDWKDQPLYIINETNITTEKLQKLVHLWADILNFIACNVLPNVKYMYIVKILGKEKAWFKTFWNILWERLKFTHSSPGFS